MKRQMKMKWRDVLALGKDAAEKWDEHNAPRLSASLAFYTLLSLAPVMVLLVLICGLVFSRTSAEEHLLDQVRSFAGYQWVEMLRSVIENSKPSKSGVIASIIASIFLVWGASGAIAELRDSLNTIWDVPPRARSFGDFVRRRLGSCAMVLALGLFVIVSTLAGFLVHLVANVFNTYIPSEKAFLGEVADVVLSFAVTTMLFALIFKFLPDVHVAWRDVAIGSCVTALLFTIGHTLLSLYMTKAAIGSAYGAAGSIVAFVAWIYYCAQIFFFGAVLTRVYASREGSRSQKASA